MPTGRKCSLAIPRVFEKQSLEEQHPVPLTLRGAVVRAGVCQMAPPPRKPVAVGTSSCPLGLARWPICSVKLSYRSGNLGKKEGIFTFSPPRASEEKARRDVQATLRPHTPRRGREMQVVPKCVCVWGGGVIWL